MPRLLSFTLLGLVFIPDLVNVARQVGSCLGQVWVRCSPENQGFQSSPRRPHRDSASLRSSSQERKRCQADRSSRHIPSIPRHLCIMCAELRNLDGWRALNLGKGVGALSYGPDRASGE